MLTVSHAPVCVPPPRVQVRYMERDAADLQAAGAGAQHRDAMQDIFLQVSRSCWLQAVLAAS